VPTALATTFSKKMTPKAILYVPGGSKSSYAAATGWSAFSQIQERTSVAVSVIFNGGNGSAIINGVEGNTANVDYGKPLSVKFIPDAGNMITSVTLNGKDITAGISEDTNSHRFASGDCHYVVELAPTVGIDGISSDQENEADIWYNLQGHRIEHPALPGIYIRNGRKLVIR